MERKKIAFVMNTPSALRAFMADHIHYLSQEYNITIYCNLSTDRCDSLFDKDNVRLINIPFERKIVIWKDIQCLLMLFFSFRKKSFHSIHSILPKSGLLAMIAGWTAGVPVRLHMFTGQVWVTKKGFFRIILKSMDKIIDYCATDIYTDSPSQRDFLIKEGVISNGRVIGDGSVNGVETDRFKPNLLMRHTVRKKFGITEDTIVFGILGRLTFDKGIIDCINSFSFLVKEYNNICLLIVGQDEDGIEFFVKNNFSKIENKIYFNKYTSNPEFFLSAMDVFCQQSYREGFGSSVIQAAACGVPALASRIYGLTDAVKENITGLMHEPGNIKEICEGMRRYADNRDFRRKLGRYARQRVLAKFSRDRLVREMALEYKRLLK